MPYHLIDRHDPAEHSTLARVEARAVAGARLIAGSAEALPFSRAGPAPGVSRRGPTGTAIGLLRAIDRLDADTLPPAAVGVDLCLAGHRPRATAREAQAAR